MPKIDPIFSDDKEMILEGLEGIIPKYQLDKMWQIIYERWKYYENFCNKKR